MPHKLTTEIESDDIKNNEILHFSENTLQTYVLIQNLLGEKKQHF